MCFLEGTTSRDEEDHRTLLDLRHRFLAFLNLCHPSQPDVTVVISSDIDNVTGDIVYHQNPDGSKIYAKLTKVEYSFSSFRGIMVDSFLKKRSSNVARLH